MSEENKTIIKALNMYGRIPETYELLNEIERLTEINKNLENAISLNNIRELQQEIERLNNKEEQLIRKLEDLIIVGKEVENEWAVDICNMVIQELKESDKE